MKESGIVIALGGNALSPAAEGGDVAAQFAHTRSSMAPIVELARDGWRIAIVHGNGPQVGNALIRHEAARDEVPPLPMGLLVAETAGWIGYMIQQSLQNALAAASVERRVATIVTQTIVDRDDPSVREPTKPIGPVFDEQTAERYRSERGWAIGHTDRGWRHVVPSPRPLAIAEARLIGGLVRDGTIVVAAGGGGIPVYHDPNAGLTGVDGVVDKDRAAAVLAREIGASVLLILTDVDAVYHAFGTPEQRPIRRLPLGEARRLLGSGAFGKGSMAPKVDAAAQFVSDGGKRAIIAQLEQGHAAIAGEAGTEVVRD